MRNLVLAAGIVIATTHSAGAITQEEWDKATPLPSAPNVFDCMEKPPTDERASEFHGARWACFQGVMACPDRECQWQGFRMCMAAKGWKCQW